MKEYDEWWIKTYTERLFLHMAGLLSADGDFCLLTDKEFLENGERKI